MINFHLLPTPHEEAAKLIEGKATVTREIFDRLPDEIQARAFVVTGIESHDVLQSLRDRIADLPQGADWDEVKEDIVAGLSPHMSLVDAEKRAQILMRHHGFSAYAAAQAQVQDELIDVFPFRQYISTDDAVVRPTHAALNGIVLPADHPFWVNHTPPWEWNCRCDVVEMTELDADEEKARDKRRNPENQRVLKGAALAQLETGQLNRGPNIIVDVRTPRERGGNYENNVRNLTLPYEEISKRWDDETRTDFETWAASVVIPDKGNLLDWVSGKVTFIPPRQLEFVLPDAPRSVDLIAMKSALSALDSRRTALRLQMAELDTTSEAGRAEFRKLVREEGQLVEEAREVVALPRAQRGKVKLTATAPARRVAKQGAEIVEAYTHPDILPEVFFSSTADRSGYNPATRRIELRKTAKATVAAHEITHGTELQNPEIKKKAVAFLKKRAGGESPVRLRDVTGLNYKASEITFEDDWVKLGGNAYTGKKYPSEATEILTMGIERLHANPAEFAAQDPDFFDFVISTLQDPTS